MFFPWRVHIDILLAHRSFEKWEYASLLVDVVGNGRPVLQHLKAFEMRINFPRVTVGPPTGDCGSIRRRPFPGPSYKDFGLDRKPIRAGSRHHPALLHQFCKQPARLCPIAGKLFLSSPIPPRGKLGASSGSLHDLYALTNVVSPLRLRSRSWQVRSVSARASRLGTP